MPGLSGKTSNQKKTTPRPKKEDEDAKIRTYTTKGLEKVKKDEMSMMATASPIASLPTCAQGSEMKKKTILDLPSETQKDIFRCSSTVDLISLSLVSKHFREIAAEQLYRTFHIVFPDEEDSSNDVPIDGLAGGLDTFVTSDYNYARHLREIVLESLSGGEKGERAYRHYLYDVSCGKFMNTLLLLTLRKAKSLETFKWDIRVELGREIFKALHSIRSLQHLHLRMQAGDSMYQSPPAILGSQTNLTSAPPFQSNSSNYLPPGYIFSHSSSQSLASKATSHKLRRSGLDLPDQTPPTLSGFRDLKTLAVLDLDTLDYASEIETCISNSSGTLTSLKLSFSDALSNQSRKPPPEVVSDDDSDQEDEFQVGMPPGMPPPPGQTSSGISDPSKAVNAMEQKKNQESFLARIFGVENLSNAKHPLSPVEAEAEAPPIVPLSILQLRSKFLKTLAPVFQTLFSPLKDDSKAGPAEEEVFEIMRKFAEIQESYEKVKGAESTSQTGTLDSSTAKTTPETSVESKLETEEPASGSGDEPGLFDDPTDKKVEKSDPDVSNPDDINVEEPEGQELAIDSEQAAEPPAESADDANVKPENVPETSNMQSVLAEKREQLRVKQIELQSTAMELLKSAEAMKTRIKQMKADFNAGKSAHNPLAASEIEAAETIYAARKESLDEMSLELQIMGDRLNGTTRATNTTKSVSKGSSMSEYVRKTRGLTLSNLAIYLVPIKASVLNKALDLTVLSSITLLNVGIQIPFWNNLARINMASPLPLQKIHTDNVTTPFLVFVSQLHNVTELFLLERTLKTKVETMAIAGKTMVTIDHIRRMILKRHAATLKVLMIRSDAGSEWDMNVKTAMLLCQRAKLLEELSVSFGVRTMHTLLQFMPGLVSLRALHTIKFRSDDICMWVMHEFRKFTADNVSHNPHMKLEYIAVDTTLERLVRRVPKNKVESKGKGKEAAAISEKFTSNDSGWQIDSSHGTPTLDSLANLPLTSAGQDTMNLFDDSENEDTAEWGVGLNGKLGLKVESIEGLQFCDISGVRIFEKDILGGRL